MAHCSGVRVHGRQLQISEPLHAQLSLCTDSLPHISLLNHNPSIKYRFLWNIERLKERNISRFYYNFCWRWEGCQNEQSLIKCSLSSLPMSYLTLFLCLIILWKMMSLSSVSCQFQKQIFPEGVRSVTRTCCPCDPLSCRHFIVQLPAISRNNLCT